jgi:hypothetical protein
MTTSLLTVEFRGTRRVRLIFTGNLAAGAYTSTALYTVTCEDGSGPSPTNVVAVYAIANTPTAVELAIDEDLVSGGLYQIGCTNVPCADLSNFTGILNARVALPLTTPVNAEPAANDIDLLLYGRDLLHDGDDFVEDATGDLGTIDGRDNYRGAMGRRMMSDGLPWDDTYGPKAEQYVDGPETEAKPFAGALIAQARADDRTKQATVDIVQSDADPGDWAFEVTLVPQDNLDPVTIQIPNPA